MYNVTDSLYNAAGDGTTDDTAAIQAAIDDAYSAGGGTVYIPNGTYIVSYTNNGGGAGCLLLKTGVALLGESKTGTILKLADDQQSSTRPIMVKDCTDVSVSNMSIDGNKAGQETEEEHRAALFLWNAERVALADLNIYDCTGDAVDVYLAEDVQMERCYCYGNLRKAVTVNGPGDTRRVVVRDCKFVDNIAGLHVESEAAIYDLRIENTFMDEPSDGGYALSFGGVTDGAVVSDGCRILGGVNITSARRIHLENSYLGAGAQAAGPCPLTISFDVEDVTVNNCRIAQTADQGSSDMVVLVQAATGSSSQRPRKIVLKDCTIETVYILAAGVLCISTEDVTIDGCRFVGPSGHARAAVVATSADTFEPSIGTVLVRNCYATGFHTGVKVGGPVDGDMTALVVSNFTTEGATIGLDLDSDDRDVLQSCAVSGFNPIGVAPGNVFYSYPSCPILVGGNRGGGGQYRCTGTPEGVISEIAGATALRWDGGRSTTLYVKEDSSGATGWDAK